MYSYFKCIVYDKLLKPRQSFRITLYYNVSVAILSSIEPVDHRISGENEILILPSE